MSWLINGSGHMTKMSATPIISRARRSILSWDLVRSRRFRLYLPFESESRPLEGQDDITIDRRLRLRFAFDLVAKVTHMGLASVYLIMFFSVATRPLILKFHLWSIHKM